MKEPIANLARGVLDFHIDILPGTVSEAAPPAVTPGPSPTPVKRALEEYFPIVEINRLAIPERNAFKPIYQMHKWFARRASCVFRAILLGALKPAGTDIMQEFYRDHTHDPDTNGKVVLDPFMGGGTTVVEALRLGCKVIGIDLNPVAWFIVKTEVEPVDLAELEAAFERLANRETASGKSVRDELLSHYKTECPGCGAEADIIYVFWVKSAICTNPECKKQVPLFSSHLVAEKKPSIRFHEARCPHDDCHKSFDWEIEPATMIADPRLMLSNPVDAAGEGRGNRRWAYSLPNKETVCPWCDRCVFPEPKTSKSQRKKVRLSVLHCPHCASVFQYRGTPPDEVTCPACSKLFRWEDGNTRKSGGFVCPHCGQTDEVIESIRRLPADTLLPAKMYALQGFCSSCSGGEKEPDEDDGQQDLGVGPDTESKRSPLRQAEKTGLLWKNKGKFFKQVSPADQLIYDLAARRWASEKETLPYPEQAIPEGYNTNQMIKHGYRYWHQMFNPRQLLCLSTLLRAVTGEPDRPLREMLLSAFQMCLEANNTFARYRTVSGGRSPFGGVFARHEFHPKSTPCEINVWGPYPYYGAYSACAGKVLRGKHYNRSPFDRRIVGGRQVCVPSAEIVDETGLLKLLAQSSTSMALEDGALDAVVTDPPYSSNVNYSELGDFFYVWLRISLSKSYDIFAPDHTPKVQECVENRTRGKTASDFAACLKGVFQESNRVAHSDGLMTFTFHHEGGDAWQALLEAVCEAGWEIVAVYPVQGESESSMHLLGGSNISYDLIHVCRKRDAASVRERIAWATVRTQTRREARKEIERIEHGVYGEAGALGNADKLIVLIGKCLQLYSRHYGAVVDDKFQPVPLKTALSDIRMMVEQLVSLERPLPGELEDIDRPSYIWLTALSEKKEIKSDEVNKVTRGILDVNELLATGLLIRGRAGRGRTFEVKAPTERYTELVERFSNQPVASPSLFASEQPAANGGLFIDRLHFLIALAEGKQDLRPWLERWKPEIPQFRAAADYLVKRGRDDLKPPLRKILGMLEVGPLGFE